MFQHWNLIQNNARLFLESSQEFKSFSNGKKYRIKKVEERRIVIEREAGHDDAVLTKEQAEESAEMIHRLRSVPFRSIIKNPVATRAAFWMLHPNIDLQDEHFTWIEDLQTERPFPENSASPAGGAPDQDLSLEKALKRIRQRQYQSLFRKNLLQAYESKCLITGPAPEEALVACHIFQFNASGVNQTANGLLLRADIHLLFDSGLIHIDPETFQIHLSNKLNDSVYQSYEGQQVPIKPEFTAAARSFLIKRMEL